jgi:hypothetical protein
MLYSGTCIFVFKASIFLEITPLLLKSIRIEFSDAFYNQIMPDKIYRSVYTW